MLGVPGHEFPLVAEFPPLHTLAPARSGGEGPRAPAVGWHPAAAHGWRRPRQRGPHVRGSVDSVQPYQATAPSGLSPLPGSGAQSPYRTPRAPCVRGGGRAEAHARVPGPPPRPPHRSRLAPAAPSTLALSGHHPGAPAPTSSRPQARPPPHRPRSSPSL